MERLLKEIADLSAQGLTGGRGGHLLLQAAHTADPGEGPPGLRVLGSSGPNPGTGAQGPLGRDREQGLPKSPLLEAAD